MLNFDVINKINTKVKLVKPASMRSAHFYVRFTPQLQNFGLTK